MSDFSKMPASRGFFAPQRYEADVFDCEVSGTIPAQLNGAFVRVGGDWACPPKQPLLLHRIMIQGVSESFKERFHLFVNRRDRSSEDMGHPQSGASNSK